MRHKNVTFGPNILVCTLSHEPENGFLSNSHGYIIGIRELSGYIFDDLDLIFKVTGDIRMSNLDQKHLVCTVPMDSKLT